MPLLWNTSRRFVTWKGRKKKNQKHLRGIGPKWSCHHGEIWCGVPFKGRHESRSCLATSDASQDFSVTCFQVMWPPPRPLLLPVYLPCLIDAVSPTDRLYQVSHKQDSTALKHWRKLLRDSDFFLLSIVNYYSLLFKKVFSEIKTVTGRVALHNFLNFLSLVLDTL